MRNDPRFVTVPNSPHPVSEIDDLLVARVAIVEQLRALISVMADAAPEHGDFETTDEAARARNAWNARRALLIDMRDQIVKEIDELNRRYPKTVH